MKHLLLTTIAAALLVGTAFADTIHDAAKTGDLAGVQAELDKGVDVNAMASSGRTPLHYATQRGHKEVAELLIASGAALNVKDNSGVTPLWLAARWGHENTTALLIAAGADANAQDKRDRTPVDIADLFNHPEIVEVLREHGGVTTEELKAAKKSIHDAARDGIIEAVKQHLASGTDVNAKSDGDRFTPLHYAAVNGHEKIAELLIDNNADVNAQGNWGTTPLHRAAYDGLKEIVELLITKGADVNAKNGGGKTPLDRAIKYKRTETADLLRKHGGKTGEELKAAGK